MNYLSHEDVVSVWRCSIMAPCNVTMIEKYPGILLKQKESPDIFVMD